jgi:hypothetical protein
MNEETIVDLAIENLEKNTSFQAKWRKLKYPDNLDGEMDLIFDNELVKVLVEIKKELRSNQIHQIKRLAEEYTDFLLIAYYIDTKTKKELRALDIPYMESNGNFYLHKDKYFFWLDNNKPLKLNKEKTNRAFTKTGLKAVFHFLQFEDDVNLPYRSIAEITETALGNVPNILNGLKEQGFLLQLNEKEYKLHNKKELLERWMTAYQQDLKPSLEIGTFRFLKQDDFLNWKNIPLKSNKSWWGSEPAADLYTDYLRPEILTIYTLESRSELIKHYRLIPDPKGNVQVYQKFWKKDEVNDKMVPPLLIYVDLMNTGDRRCIETAEKIYNEFLQDKL